MREAVFMGLAILGWAVAFAQWILREPPRPRRYIIPEDLRKKHNFLKLKIKVIMAQIDELIAEAENLKTQVAGLQEDLDAEQAQVEDLLAQNAETVEALNARIAELEAGAGDNPQIAEVIASLKESVASISTSRDDLKGTIADEPEQP